MSDHLKAVLATTAAIVLTLAGWHVGAVAGVIIFTALAIVAWRLTRRWSWLRFTTWWFTGWAAFAWVILLLAGLFLWPSHAVHG